MIFKYRLDALLEAGNPRRKLLRAVVLDWLRPDTHTIRRRIGKPSSEYVMVRTGHVIDDGQVKWLAGQQ